MQEYRASLDPRRTIGYPYLHYLNWRISTIQSLQQPGQQDQLNRRYPDQPKYDPIYLEYEKLFHLLPLEIQLYCNPPLPDYMGAAYVPNDPNYGSSYGNNLEQVYQAPALMPVQTFPQECQALSFTPEWTVSRPAESYGIGFVSQEMPQTAIPFIQSADDMQGYAPLTCPQQSFPLAATSSATSRSSVRSQGRKPRTRFSPKQTELLEKCFALDPYPKAAMEAEQAQFLGLPRQVVRTWYSNRRASQKSGGKRSPKTADGLSQNRPCKQLEEWERQKESNARAEGKPYECLSGCGKRHKSKNSWMRHDDLRFPKRTWECLGCRLKVHRKDRMDTHLKRCSHAVNVAGGQYRSYREPWVPRDCRYCGEILCDENTFFDHVGRHQLKGEAFPVLQTQILPPGHTWAALPDD